MPDPTGSNPPPGKPDKDVFDLAPIEAAPADRPGKPKIDAPGLTADFDEDADFEHDPEVARALGKPDDVTATTDAVPPGEEFIKPGLGDAKIIALIGAGILLSAVIVAGFSAPSRGWAHALIVLYTTLLHACTGVGALAIAAKFSERRMGPWELGAARMLVAVALLELVFHIRLPYGIWLNTIAATGVYAVATLMLFRLAVQEWFLVVASHFGIWLVVSGAVWLDGLLRVAPVKAPGS